MKLDYLAYINYNANLLNLFCGVLFNWFKSFCFQDSPRKLPVIEVNKNGNSGAFHPFKREDKKIAEGPMAAAASSTEETGGSSGRCKVEDKEDPQRKARRCWSSELHRRFLQALEQLGGAHGLYQTEILIIFHTASIIIMLCINSASIVTRLY